MTSLVKAEYQGRMYTFNSEGWFNATDAAKPYGKQPARWLRLPSTKEYVAAVQLQNADVQKLHIATKGGAAGGGGTWMHPLLAVAFARWLNVHFSVWCDGQIDRILRGGSLYHQRLAFEAKQRESKDKGTLGGRLLNQRKREKPALEVEAAAWKRRMEPELFSPGPA